MQNKKLKNKINERPPFTEWLKKLRLKNRRDLIKEDNTKCYRLDNLHYLIGLPYDVPEKMMARDIIDKAPIFLDALRRLSDQQCALRAIPKSPSLPKFRLKG